MTGNRDAELEAEAVAAYLRLIPEARLVIGRDSYVRAYLETFLDEPGAMHDGVAPASA